MKDKPRVPADDLEWYDISEGSYRDYVYPNGFRFRVEFPNQLNVKKGPLPGTDSHLIRRRGGLTNVYVAPGWIAIEWDGDFQF